MNQEIHCHISVPGETHYLLLSGSLQPCLLGQEPVVPRPELDLTLCLDESRKDQSSGPLAAGQSLCSPFSHSPNPPTQPLSRGSEAERSPQVPNLRFHSVATLLDTLVLSNGDNLLCLFLSTGINRYQF